MSFYSRPAGNPQGWWRLLDNTNVDDIGPIYSYFSSGSKGDINDSFLLDANGIGTRHLGGIKLLYYASGTGTITAEVDAYYPGASAGASVDIFTINTAIGYKIFTRLLNMPCTHFGYSFLSNNIAFIVQRAVLFHNELYESEAL
jgi:hypothetical protein